MDTELREILVGISGDIKGMRTELNEKIDKLDLRLTNLESKVEKVEERLDQLEERFDNLEERFDNFETRFTKQEEELAAIREEIAGIDQIKHGHLVLNQKIFDVETWKLAMEQRLEKLEAKMG
ncbi:hypothetical protein ACE1TH_11875 [Shouchella sp. JSM 1781072]|uniref:hypothetical protein n=1 Tax=Shouchella sp. JSM 1781072 TaxID=3344581 RepID=UPI0035C14F9D